MAREDIYTMARALSRDVAELKETAQYCPDGPPPTNNNFSTLVLPLITLA